MNWRRYNLAFWLLSMLMPGFVSANSHADALAANGAWPDPLSASTAPGADDIVEVIVP